jgi:hypothetical protein
MCTNAVCCAVLCCAGEQVRRATASSVREGYRREAALWSTLTSGAVLLLPPHVPRPSPSASPARARGGENSSGNSNSNSNSSGNGNGNGNIDSSADNDNECASDGDGAEGAAPALTPHWAADLSEAGGGGGSSGGGGGDFYGPFLASILEQTRTRSSGAADVLLGAVPIELAAAKLLLLNGSNAKKF